MLWGQLSPRAETPEALKPQSPCSMTRVAHALQLERSPCLPQLEKARVAMKTQHSQKLIN